MDNKIETPKNVHIALVKKEDIEKDKSKRIIKHTEAWNELKGMVGGLILMDSEIFRVEEVQSKQELKKDGIFKTEYWEIDYSGLVGLSRGLNRRVYKLRKVEYKDLRQYRIAYFSMLDELETWNILKKKT